MTIVPLMTIVELITGEAPAVSCAVEPELIVRLLNVAGDVPPIVCVTPPLRTTFRTSSNPTPDPVNVPLLVKIPANRQRIHTSARSCLGLNGPSIQDSSRYGECSVSVVAECERT